MGTLAVVFLSGCPVSELSPRVNPGGPDLLAHDDWVYLSIGSDEACGLRGEGGDELYCNGTLVSSQPASRPDFGSDGGCFGRPGGEATCFTGVREDALEEVAGFGVGNTHRDYCVSKPDGRLLCDSTLDAEWAVDEPLASLVVVSPASVCGITDAGTLRCFTETEPLPIPEVLQGPGVVAQLDAIREDACALTTSGELRCWTVSDPSSTTLIPGVWRQFEVERRLFDKREVGCGVTESGGVSCWEFGGEPEALDLEPAVQVATSPGWGAALHEDGSVSIFEWSEDE